MKPGARCLLPLILPAASLPSALADLHSDSWVATDALGRKLPGYKECGPPRNGKFVGIFYFLWLGAHGAGGPYGITKILAENPTDPKWGEPEQGYYLSDDYLIRKRARMLEEAGPPAFQETTSHLRWHIASTIVSSPQNACLTPHS